MRIVAYEDEDFKLEYKIYRGKYFLHCEVSNWKPSVLKRGRKIFEEWKEKKRQEGVEMLYTVSPNPKFVALLGGEKIGYVFKKGIYYEVFIWALKQSQPSL